MPVTAEQQGASPGKEAKTYTEEQVEAIVKERLGRDRESSGYYALKEKAAKYDEWQAANKSDLEKAIERAEAAEARLAELESRAQAAAWAQEVSQATGVDARLLHGSTKEELESSAATYLELHPRQAAGVVLSEGGGRTAGGPPGESIASQVFRRRD